MTNPVPLTLPDYDIGFVDAIKRGFRKYATFDGRAGRAEFWWWTLGVYGITAVGVLIVSGLTSGGQSMGVIGGLLGFVLLAFVLATIVPTIAVTVRRLHDAGQSGWFYLLTLIPVGAFVVYILCVLPTSPKAVRYGPPGDQGFVVPPQMPGQPPVS